MKTFELRIIERTVHVLHVDAESEEAAQLAYEEGATLDFEVESFPIENEIPGGWLELIQEEK